MTRLSIFLFFLFVSSASAHAQSSVNISLNELISFNVLQTQGQTSTSRRTQRSNEPIGALREIQIDFLNKNYQGCIDKISKNQKRLKIVSTWIYKKKIECALSLDLTTPKSIQVALEIFFEHAKIFELNNHFSSADISKLLIQLGARIINAEINNKNFNHRSLWDALYVFLPQMNEFQKADYYVYGAELSWLSKNPFLTFDFFKKSLENHPREGVYQRLMSLYSDWSRRENIRIKSLEDILTTAASDLKISEAITTRADRVSLSSYSSVEEKAFERRVQVSLERKDLVAALEDSVKALKEFPGSSFSYFFNKQILTIYLNVAVSSEPQWLNVKRRLLKIMIQADGVRLHDWSTIAYEKGYYEDALFLSSAALLKLQGQPLSTKSLWIKAMSALNLKRWALAQKDLEVLVKQHAGSVEADKALIRLGLLLYRRGQYAESTDYFEKHLLLKTNSDDSITAHYWLWKAQQKLKTSRATNVVNDLIRKHPLSFYGMLARLETENSISLSHNKAENKLNTVRFDMTFVQKPYWERLWLLLQSGWQEEARSELQFFVDPLREDSQYFWALIHARLFLFEKAEKLFVESVPREALWSKNSLQGLFPQISISQLAINNFTNIEKVSTYFLIALLREKPDFFYLSESRTLLEGLSKESSSLFSLLRLHVDETLLKVISPHFLSKNFSNDFFQDEAGLWIEELPWSTSSMFIKTILRNVMMNRLLDQGQIQFDQAPWRF